MTLKRIFDKTIEAARNSARQMFGDDFVVVDANPYAQSNGQASADITVMSDRRRDKRHALDIPTKDETHPSAVTFQKSSRVQKRKQKNPNSNLEALRRYAGKQIAEETKRESSDDGKTAFIPRYSDASHSKTRQLYSRASIRRAKARIPKTENSNSELTADQEQRFNQTPFSPSLLSAASNQINKTESASGGQSDISREETNSLNKRFDKLEALLRSELISVNMEYISHPAFQQLIHTGMSHTVVASWFREIIQEGIDPFEHSKVFMEHLSNLIRNSLNFKQTSAARKYLLFTGPSGSGKTHLIMKLALHPECLSDKKVGIASVLPKEQEHSAYYTILEPFCDDQNISYFKVQYEQDVLKLMQRWSDFDHLLIDTSPLNVDRQSPSIERSRILELLSSLTSMEEHFVIRISQQQHGNLFDSFDSTKRPDYLAITHLDEVHLWGPIIPLLSDLNCAVQYISTGESIPGGLEKFNPKWFAQKVLQDT